MQLVKKFGPLVLAGLAAGLTAVSPDLIAQYPQTAGIIAILSMLLSSFAPQPQKK